MSNFVQKLLRKALTIIAFSLMLGVGLGVSPALQPTGYAATTCNTASQSAQDALDGAGLAGADCGDTGDKLNNVIKTIVNLLSAIVGVIAVVMIIIGGFKYITSGGDSNKVSGAKNTLVYAIVGLFIVALAQLIVHFVIQTADNANKVDTTPSASAVVRLYRP